MSKYIFIFRQGEINIFENIRSRFIQVISLRDCPYRLSKSMALGFGLALLPLPAINIPLGVLLAKLLRLNIIATTIPALLLSYIAPILYVLNYKTGALFITSNKTHPTEFEYDLSFWDKLVDFFAHAGPAYLLGSAINAMLAAGAAYVVFLYVFKNTSKLFKDKKMPNIKRKNPGE